MEGSRHLNVDCFLGLKCISPLLSRGMFILVNGILDAMIQSDLACDADLKKSSVKPARCIILGTVTASINDKEAEWHWMISDDCQT